ncbi:hypothetical protein [Nonomuraea recticatena]|uniref:hypothetical protein n=1 Tax=Nonomuraea recticatena TaxID=46178 RepID=UPI0031FA1D8F
MIERVGDLADKEEAAALDLHNLSLAPSGRFLTSVPPDGVEVRRKQPARLKR